MSFLWNRFQEATINPQIAATHRPKAFETEIRLLLERNTFYADPKTDAGLKHRQNGYCLEFALHDTLIDAFGCNVERFANPLDVWRATNKNLILTGRDAFYSAVKRDEIFGATHDAYSTRWTGSSIALPPHTQAEALKALKWAINSAKATEEPTLTCLVITAPEADNDLLTKLLAHRLVKVITKIPEKGLVLFDGSHIYLIERIYPSKDIPRVSSISAEPPLIAVRIHPSLHRGETGEPG